MVTFIDRLGGQGPVWLVNWLTPIWIVSVGVLLGLLGCLAIWGLTYLLSRVPALGNLSNDRARKWIGIAAVTAILYALSAYFLTDNLAAQMARPVAVGEDAAAVKPVSAFIPHLILFAGSFLAAFSLIHLINRKAADQTVDAVREGPLWPLFLGCCGIALFAILGTFIARTPGSLLETLARWPQLAVAGSDTRTHEIAAPPADFDEPPVQPIDVNFRKSEIARILFRSNERLRVAFRTYDQTTPADAIVIVPAEENAMWRKPADGSNPFGEDRVTKLYVKNFGEGPATLTVTTISAPAHLEMTLVPVVAAAVMLVFLAYVVVRAAFPKLAAVLLATTKSEIAQPLFVLLLGGGMLLLTLFIIIPYNTFGEDIKMLQDTGLQCILLLAMIQGVWAASSSVADEIEGKTALTLLSKPVSRRDFILGKFLGISWATLLLVCGLGLVLLLGVAYKPLYDQREGAEFDATWQLCFDEMARTLPGMVLAFLAVVVLISLAVAFSTRLPTLANLIVCFSIFVLGNLMPAVVQSQVVAQQFEPVVVIGRVISTVLPIFEHFNTTAAISAGQNVPPVYIGAAFLYCVLYSSIAMLLALTLFEDRDLA